MVPKPHWKQETPRGQLIALLSSVEGLVSNVSDGIYGNDILAEKLDVALEQLRDAQLIATSLPKGEWSEIP